MLVSGERLRLVRTNRIVRIAAFAYCLLPIGLYLWEHHAGWAAWALFAVQFLAYPHLAYWRAVSSARPSRAELDNLLLDSTLLGAWSAYLGFPAWISFALISSAMLNAAVNRGAPGALLSLACSAAGAGLWFAVGGFHFEPETSAWVSGLGIAGSLAYISGVGFVVHAQNRRFVATRDELRRSEERYRLIAENAADLVAMLDYEGRWLYTSPSYDRIMDRADLALGADAFKRFHPDDAEQARLAVARAAATGKPRELALRMVDREGRIRQYKVRMHAVGNGEPPRKLLVVSHDVTDLRESEERLLLAAHAFEGMTEAIMITAADGTIVTVNRAFSDITGHARGDVLGQSEKTVRSALQPHEFYDELYTAVQREGYWSGTSWNRRKNGSVYREWRSVRPVRSTVGDKGEVTHEAVTHYVHVFYEVGAPGASARSTGNPVGA